MVGFLRNPLHICSTGSGPHYVLLYLAYLTLCKPVTEALPPLSSKLATVIFAPAVNTRSYSRKPTSPYLATTASVHLFHCLAVQRYPPEVIPIDLLEGSEYDMLPTSTHRVRERSEREVRATQRHHKALVHIITTGTGACQSTPPCLSQSVTHGQTPTLDTTHPNHNS
jgi:hypothetical protein